MRGHVALAAAVMALCAACRSAPREAPDQVMVDSGSPLPGNAPATGTLAISALVPDSVRLAPNTISEVVVRGTGFAPGGANVVRIGPIMLNSVASNAAGTELRIVVPARYTTNQEAPPRPLFPGEYPVSVEAGGKTSNSKMLKVLP